MPPIAAGSIDHSIILKRGLLPTSKCFCKACNRAKKICLSAKKLNFCEPALTFLNGWRELFGHSQAPLLSDNCMKEEGKRYFWNNKGRELVSLRRFHWFSYEKFALTVHLNQTFHLRNHRVKRFIRKTTSTWNWKWNQRNSIRMETWVGSRFWPAVPEWTGEDEAL